MTDSPSMDAIAAMSPAEATAALAAMDAVSTSPAPIVPAAATPTVASSVEASAKLAALTSDQAFRERLLNGDVSAAKLFKELVKAVDAAGSDVEIAMSGALPDLPDSQLKTMASTAEWLRGKGFSPRAIREALDDKPATQGDIDLATRLKSQHGRSPQFIKDFLAGEPDSEMRMLAANIILSKSET